MTADDQLAGEPRSGERPELVAYRIPGMAEMSIVPAPAGRAWMARTRDHLATRCLPLVMANQAGWLLLNPERIRVRWTGASDRAALRIDCLDDAGRMPRFAESLFGHGIVTFTVPYLFRTSPGWNLEVRGPTNMPKDGAAPLDGLVETDWSVATFTINWKVTRPDHWIGFDEHEPIALIRPTRRGELAEFEPSVRGMDAEPELLAQFRAWNAARRLHNGQKAVARRMFGEPGAAAVGWQRHYWTGTSPGGASAPPGQHQTRLALRQFDGGAAPVAAALIPGIRADVACGPSLDAGRAPTVEVEGEAR